MVVASPGLTMITNWPARNTCTSTTLGVHKYGVLISPTSSRIGLGKWQRICSLVGSLISPETTRQTGEALGAFGSFCVKSKAPGPSDVPAANEYPKAAGQVWT